VDALVIELKTRQNAMNGLGSVVNESLGHFKVFVELDLYKISDIDTKSHSVSLDLKVNCYWKDPRIVKILKLQPSAEQKEKLRLDVWSPVLVLANATGSTKTTRDSKAVIQNATEGYLCRGFTINGPINCPMQNLMDFPYDINNIPLLFLATNRSSVYKVYFFSSLGYKKLNLKKDNATPVVKKRHLLKVIGNPEMLCPEFEFLGYKGARYYTRGKSAIQIHIAIARRWKWYCVKVLTLEYYLVLFAHAPCIFPIEDIAAKVGVLSTTFLAAAASMHFIGQCLPRCNFLTALDTVTFLCMTHLGIMLAIVCTAYVMHIHHELDGQRFQTYAILVLDTIFVAANLCFLLFPWCRQAKLKRKWRSVNEEENNERHEARSWKHVLKITAWTRTQKHVLIKGNLEWEGKGTLLVPVNYIDANLEYEVALKELKDTSGVGGLMRVEVKQVKTFKGSELRLTSMDKALMGVVPEFHVLTHAHAHPVDSGSDSCEDEDSDSGASAEGEDSSGDDEVEDMDNSSNEGRSIAGLRFPHIGGGMRNRSVV
jgi:hypothetical protein